MKVIVLNNKRTADGRPSANPALIREYRSHPVKHNFCSIQYIFTHKKKKNYKKKKKRKRSHIFSRQTWTAMLGLEQSVHLDVEVWHNSYPLIDKSLFGTTRCDQKESREQNGSDLWLLLTENHNRHAEGRNPKLSLNTFLHYHSSYTFKLISFAGI